MSKHIPLESQNYARDGVVIKKEKLLSIIVDKNKIVCAQKQAKKIIKDALKESESIRETAWFQGYSDGVLCSIDSVVDYIASGHLMAQSVYKSIHNDVNENLYKILNKPEVFESNIKNWLAEINSKDTNVTLEILLPRKFINYKPTLLLGAKNIWPGGVNIELHDEFFFSIKLRDKIMEFVPKDVSMDRSTDMLSTKRLSDKYEDISNKVLSELPSRVNSMVENRFK